MALLSENELHRLVNRAVAARKKAHAPYSRFLVGSAILTTGGEIIEGCNVENLSYGLSICAERVAASSAVVAGYREWTGIVVASEGGVPPCGACRQFLLEFKPDLEVILVNVADGSRQIFNLADLLPDSFDSFQAPAPSPQD